MTQERDLKTELDALDEQSANPVESWPENVFSQGTSDAVKALGVEDAIARATQEQEAARKAEWEATQKRNYDLWVAENTYGQGLETEKRQRLQPRKPRTGAARLS